MVVGLVELVGIDMPSWAEWVLFGALSLILMFTIRRQFYNKLRAQAVGLKKPGAGDTIEVAEALAPGASCRTDYRGSRWTAINVGAAPIPPGSSAVIEQIDGLNLRVRLPG